MPMTTTGPGIVARVGRYLNIQKKGDTTAPTGYIYGEGVCIVVANCRVA